MIRGRDLVYDLARGIRANRLLAVEHERYELFSELSSLLAELAEAPECSPVALELTCAGTNLRAAASVELIHSKQLDAERKGDA